jgi:MFS family permease
MGLGALLVLVTVGVAHAGTSVLLFWTALVLLGVGWNFLYVGGSTLLVGTHRRSEGGKVQGLNDMLVFAGMGISSLLSGALLYQLGWQNMALATLPLIAATLAVLAWAFTKSPAQTPAHAR